MEEPTIVEVKESVELYTEGNNGADFLKVHSGGVTSAFGLIEVEVGHCCTSLKAKLPIEVITAVLHDFILKGVVCSGEQSMLDCDRLIDATKWPDEYKAQLKQRCKMTTAGPIKAYTDTVDMFFGDLSHYTDVDFINVINEAQQRPEIASDSMLQECQFWVFKPHASHGITFDCERDTNDVVYSLHIPELKPKAVGLIEGRRERVVLYLSLQTLCFIDER